METKVKPIDQTMDWKRSDPDLVVYLPQGKSDTDNEHFLVFEAPQSDELLALWNQSSCEDHGDNHIVIARSDDAANWSHPQFIVGAKSSDELQASWGFPVVSRQGRIYCFYLRETGVADVHRQMTGAMGCAYSDDNGHTWINGADIAMRRDKYDHPDGTIPKNWIVWQKPIRDSEGRWLAGYTQWTSKAIRPDSPSGNWYGEDSRCKFMRFDNIDQGPDPENIEITWLPDDEAGLAVPFPDSDIVSVAQEPSIVLLPDNRIFSTMRTFTGFIWYSVSEDDGKTWRKPEVLRYKDQGQPINQPIAPCPIYPMSDGRYLLIFHNNDGQVGPHGRLDFLHNRRPAYLAVGGFRPNAHQPIWFSQAREILDTQGVTIGPKGTSEIATYTSYTEFHDKRILWYPDRKYYLLGKYITDDLLANMTID